MNELHELLARIAATPGSFAVSLSLHNVPLETAAEWLAAGLLDSLVAGVRGNPVTGRLRRELNDEPRRTVAVNVLTTGPRAER